MHIIIGIGRQVKLLPVLLLLLLMSCNSQPQEEAQSEPTRVKVKTTGVSIRDLVISETLPAQVVYLSKSDITAPSAGYIIHVAVKTGEHVQKGELLFMLETKEHRILKNDTSLADEGIRSMGTFSVKAPASGYISTMQQQQGDYVQEGAVLCSFTRDDQIFFKAFVPIRLGDTLSKGTPATIILPDSSTIQGKVKEIMNELNAASQSLQVLVVPQVDRQFPENLNAEVSFVIDRRPQAQLIPHNALLSDEELESFWVMKLVNDSTAVKVPVRPGITRSDSVQVVQPRFEPGVRLLTEGNYGLADTAKVEVQQ